MSTSWNFAGLEFSIIFFISIWHQYLLFLSGAPEPGHDKVWSSVIINVFVDVASAGLDSRVRLSGVLRYEGVVGVQVMGRPASRRPGVLTKPNKPSDTGLG
jgi:hypothetical protein